MNISGCGLTLQVIPYALQTKLRYDLSCFPSLNDDWIFSNSFLNYLFLLYIICIAQDPETLEPLHIRCCRLVNDLIVCEHPLIHDLHIYLKIGGSVGHVILLLQLLLLIRYI